jgi:tryptophan-rich sensory protein
MGQHMLVWKKSAISILPVVAAVLLGQSATFPNLAPWYAGLAKPSFNPPNWIFGPVWIALYALMAVAVWRVLGADARQKHTALFLFFVQLAFNAVWSWMFFGLHDPLLGLVNIVPQWLLVVATMLVFWRIDSLAGLCLLPLAGWVAFASLLNFEIWRLN